MDQSVFPVFNSLNAPFWKAAGENRLELPFCITTGQSFWPPSLFSPFTTGGTVAWRSLSPSGILVARVVYRRSFLKAFEPLMPYGIGLVELDAGPRLQALMRDPDGPAPVQPGDRVRLEFKKWLSGVDILTAVAA